MKAELPRYPAYEPTQFEWLGEMPAGWKAIQLARINTKLTNGFVGPTRDILQEKGVRYLQSLHIKGGRIIFDEPYFVSEEWSAKHDKSVLKTGDVLIVQTGDIGQVAAVTDEFAGCNCHALIIVSSNRKMIDGHFLSAVLRSHYGFHSLKSVQTGALHPHLNCTKIRDIYLPIPPLEDQRAILTFLRQETGKIDRLMTARWKQVERLQEQRTAVVQDAVTKGVDPQAKTKPSCVEWLGDVPKGWDVLRLRFCCSIRGGVGFPEKYQGSPEGEYPFLKNSDINTTGRFVSTAENYVGRELAAEQGWSPVPAQSIILGKIGEALRKNHRVIAAVDCLIDNNLMALVPKPLLFERDFFFYLFTLVDMDWFTDPGTVPSVSIRRFSDMKLVVPPKQEQREIVGVLDCETATIDALIAKYYRELELLAEYRASLISHAVTGKIDVRGLVAPNQIEEMAML